MHLADILETTTHRADSELTVGLKPLPPLSGSISPTLSTAVGLSLSRTNISGSRPTSCCPVEVSTWETDGSARGAGQKETTSGPSSGCKFEIELEGRRSRG
jgi:hypothetical protein